jgi:hypothetical protein
VIATLNQIDHTNRIEAVAIVDDDLRAARAQEEQVIDAGFKPIIVKGVFKNVVKLAAEIERQSQAAICDHRLFNSGFANFYGAELVAELYVRGFPAILITTFLSQDYDVSIRKFRRRIPVLLGREELEAETIINGLKSTTEELAGNIPNSRRPHRTLVRVQELRKDSNEYVLDVIIPSWNLERAVTFPAVLVPEPVLKRVRASIRRKTPVHLFADVNIDAERDDDIYIDNLEIAPEPDDDDGLA